MTLMFRPESLVRLDVCASSRLPVMLNNQVPKNADGDKDPLKLVKQVSLDPREASKLVCLTDEVTPAGEAFRLVGVRLRLMRRDRPLKNLLITSTIPQEGK